MTGPAQPGAAEQGAASTAAPSRRFVDRVAFVTGGASGIGQAVVQRLADEGAFVYAADRNAQRLSELWDADERVEAVPVDVADSASVDAAFARVQARHGRLDVLVNAAGVSDLPSRLRDGKNGGPELHTISDEAWDFVVKINLYGPFYCMRAAVPLLKRNGERGAAVVNISSVGALAPYPLPAAYPASKAGVLGLTRATAALLGADNIRVNAVAPAATKTPMLPTDEELLASLLDLQVLKRAVPPSEMAATIVYLCSDEAAFITGQTISPNGGYVM